MTHHVESEEGGQAVRPTSRMTRFARTGWAVFATLMVLVLLEYVVSLVLDRNLPLMVAMNVADALLIMYYFMHVSRLWRREEKA